MLLLLLLIYYSFHQLDIPGSTNKVGRNLKNYMAYLLILTKIFLLSLAYSSLFRFSFVSSSLIVVLRRKVRLFAFPSFSQWYKKKGNWREDIAGAREIEGACVCLCIIVYPACKVGMISVNEVTLTFVTFKQTLDFEGKCLLFSVYIVSHWT